MRIPIKNITTVLLTIFVVFAGVGFASPLVATTLPGSNIATSKITVGDDSQVFAIADSNYLQGGHMQVATRADMLAITSQRRSLGMLVTVIDDDLGTGGNQTVMYSLTSNPHGTDVPCDAGTSPVTDNSLDGKDYPAVCQTTDISHWTEYTSSGAGSVSTFSAGDLSPLFTTSVSTATTTPALSFTLSDQVANTFFAGPTSGIDATPTFRTMVLADLPMITSGNILVGTGTGTSMASVAVSGDATLASSGALTIANNAVTYAKFQQMSAGSILGNPTGSAADASEITLGSGLAFSGTTLTSSTTVGAAIASGTANQVLFADGSGNLAQTANFVYNQAGDVFSVGFSGSDYLKIDSHGSTGAWQIGNISNTTSLAYGGSLSVTADGDTTANGLDLAHGSVTGVALGFQMRDLSGATYLHSSGGLFDAVGSTNGTHLSMLDSDQSLLFGDSTHTFLQIEPSASRFALGDINARDNGNFFSIKNDENVAGLNSATLTAAFDVHSKKVGVDNILTTSLISGVGPLDVTASGGPVGACGLTSFVFLSFYDIEVADGSLFNIGDAIQDDFGGPTGTVTNVVGNTVTMDTGGSTTPFLPIAGTILINNTVVGHSNIVSIHDRFSVTDNIVLNEEHVIDSAGSPISVGGCSVTLTFASTLDHVYNSVFYVQDKDGDILKLQNTADVAVFTVEGDGAITAKESTGAYSFFVANPTTQQYKLGDFNEGGASLVIDDSAKSALMTGNIFQVGTRTTGTGNISLNLNANTGTYQIGDITGYDSLGRNVTSGVHFGIYNANNSDTDVTNAAGWGTTLSSWSASLDDGAGNNYLLLNPYNNIYAFGDHNGAGEALIIGDDSGYSGNTHAVTIHTGAVFAVEGDTGTNPTIVSNTDADKYWMGDINGDYGSAVFTYLDGTNSYIGINTTSPNAALDVMNLNPASSTPTVTPSTDLTTAVAQSDATGTTATVVYGGRYYTSAPSVTASGGTCTTLPTAGAVVTSGVVTSIGLSGGSCTAAPTLVIDPPTGSDLHFSSASSVSGATSVVIDSMKVTIGTLTGAMSCGDTVAQLPLVLAGGSLTWAPGDSLPPSILMGDITAVDGVSCGGAGAIGTGSVITIHYMMSGGVGMMDPTHFRTFADSGWYLYNDTAGTASNFAEISAIGSDMILVTDDGGETGLYEVNTTSDITIGSSGHEMNVHFDTTANRIGQLSYSISGSFTSNILRALDHLSNALFTVNETGQVMGSGFDFNPLQNTYRVGTIGSSNSTNFSIGTSPIASSAYMKVNTNGIFTINDGDGNHPVFKIDRANNFYAMGDLDASLTSPYHPTFRISGGSGFTGLNVTNPKATLDIRNLSATNSYVSLESIGAIGSNTDATIDDDSGSSFYGQTRLTLTGTTIQVADSSGYSVGEVVRGYDISAGPYGSDTPEGHVASIPDSTHVVVTYFGHTSVHFSTSTHTLLHGISTATDQTILGTVDIFTWVDADGTGTVDAGTSITVGSTDRLIVVSFTSVTNHDYGEVLGLNITNNTILNIADLSGDVLFALKEDHTLSTMLDQFMVKDSAGTHSVLSLDITNTGGGIYSMGDTTNTITNHHNTWIKVDDTATHLVTVSGDLTVVGSGTTCAIGTGTGGTSCTSDARLKTNIENLPSALEQIGKLRPVTFTWIDTTKQQGTNIGFIAQEVKDIFPQFVTQIGDYYAVDYAGLITPTIRAVQEMNLKIDLATSLDVSREGSLATLIRAYLGDALNGVQSLFADKVTTKQLCIEDVCVTKDELKKVLNQANVQSALPLPDPAPSPDPTPETPVADPVPPADVPVAPDVVPPPTDPVVPVEQGLTPPTDAESITITP